MSMSDEAARSDELEGLHSMVACCEAEVEKLQAELGSLAGAVAEFLDADAAWDNGEISEKDYTATITELKRHVAEAQKALA